MAEVERRRACPAAGLALATEAIRLAEAMEMPEIRWRALTVAGRLYIALHRVADARRAFDDAIATVDGVRALNRAARKAAAAFSRAASRHSMSASAWRWPNRTRQRRSMSPNDRRLVPCST